MTETTTTERPWSDYPRNWTDADQERFAVLPKHASAPKETKNMIKPYKPCNFTRHVNNFGNIDTRERLPVGYVHIRGQRLGPIARKVGARKWAVAFTGFQQGHSVRDWRAITDGIVCSRKIAPKIRAEIARLKANREEREEDCCENEEDDDFLGYCISLREQAKDFLKKHGKEEK